MRLGEHTFGSEIDCFKNELTNKTVCADPSVDVEVEKILIHPRYRQTNVQNENDIALLRLKHSINFTRK